jgi:hypothetical protein
MANRKALSTTFPAAQPVAKAIITNMTPAVTPEVTIA